MSSPAKPVFTVRVRDLVDFALRRGDLGGERDFVGSDRALAGTRGHQKIQRSRPTAYQKELALAHELQTEQFTLRVQGRLDGLLVTEAEVLLEEIKTVHGHWDRVADPLHWAQAKCYGYIYCHDHALEKITLQLTYLELESGVITELRESFTFAELQKFFADATAIYLEWIHDRYEWCQKRDASIRALEFPFAGFRPGQRQLAVKAYHVLAKGGRLFLEAPTGIGKTLSVLFPAVKAMTEGNIERIFYLTARTVGRTIAEKACADLRQNGLLLRTVTLTAKEKLCVRDGHPCDATTCPLAIGYYDRHKAAMRAALDQVEITRPVLERVATEHQVCPFELALDVSTWVDAVICDYNYVFDPRVYLRRHFGEDGGDYAFLVDEAHNLVDRAREMFSAGLDSREIQEVRRAVKSVPRCARALTKLHTALRKLAASPELSAAAEPSDPDSELNLFPARRVGPVDSSALTRIEGIETQATRNLPEGLLDLVDSALEEAETWLAQNRPADFREALLQLYFHLFAFRRTAELYDERFVTIIESDTATRVRLFCLDPSFLLGQALERGKAAIFFSATLAPLDYYRALLGGGAEDPALQLKSPFPPEHLQVLVHDRIPTTLKARTASVPRVAEAIAALVAERAGNYLVYFPSYKYLTAVQEQFQVLCPDTTVIAQRTGMTEAEREAFLAAFRVAHGQTLVGFAVMGGIFGEGIDLVGEQLIGAVIVGVGMPQLSVERDLIRDHFQSASGDGFGYAYTFPGMNRVLQAVGRVIRSGTDRGVVLLIDTRFVEARYRNLFPAWWQTKRVRTTQEIKEAAHQFWWSDAEAEK